MAIAHRAKIYHKEERSLKTKLSNYEFNSIRFTEILWCSEKMSDNLTSIFKIFWLKRRATKAKSSKAKVFKANPIFYFAMVKSIALFNESHLGQKYSVGKVNNGVKWNYHNTKSSYVITDNVEFVKIKMQIFFTVRPFLRLNFF